MTPAVLPATSEGTLALTAPGPVCSPWVAATISGLEKHGQLFAVILVLVATVRIAATWHVFNVTTDKATHIACGMEWLDKHTYTGEDQHPPLGRVAAALGPFLAGIRSQGKNDLCREGEAIILAGGRLGRNQALARAGVLPFFWLGCLVVFLWAQRLAGPAGGALAVLMFTSVPPVLGHAGLATTDMPLVATLGAAVLACIYWVDRPSLGRSTLLGLAGGAAAISKFSSLPFFAAAFVCALVWHAVVKPAKLTGVRFGKVYYVLVSLLLASVVIWAAYWFSYANWPAPEFFSGLRSVRLHNNAGERNYLLGSISQAGFKMFFPVALAVETPIPYLVLLVVGAVVVLQRRRLPEYGYPLASAVGILAFVITYSRLNFGIRHVLPVYVGFSIVAAFGLLSLLQHGRLSAWLGLVLAVWLVVANIAAHPDYFPYFNELAGSKPERILIDSDLDWGQDMKRLAIRLRELKVTEFTYLPVIFLDLAGVEFPPVRLMDLEKRSPGWHAAHITPLIQGQYQLRMEKSGVTFWTDEIAPVERVGRGILLWHVPGAR